MKRRDAMRLVPLSLAGIAGMSNRASAQDMRGKAPEAGPGAPLAVQYTRKVQERLTWIRENQSESLMEASYAIARTVENGGQCYQVSWDAGHTEGDSWDGRNGEPEIFKTSFDIKKAKKGDLLMTCGQNRDVEEAKKKGVFIIGAPSSWSGDARYPELLREDVQALKIRPYADIFIENNATSLGGVINVPGMPAPIGPVSGIVGKTTLWMMIADACRILARRGEIRPVKGDGPKLKGDTIDYRNFAGWVKLTEPLMDDYFNEVITQLRMVMAEYGTIKRIAAMSVDSILDGGTIYGYSLHNSIAGEASTRRSGLVVTDGVYSSTLDTPEKRRNFKGTSRDFAIMGITKPDDETDLEFLDMFHERGMKVASLGAMTRSLAVPEGRTVHGESDIHAGRMCDTYGLFAVPGFERRICPTSGVLLDHLYWCTMMEVVDQFMERTGGDIPGVYFSGALKGGMEHLFKMRSTYMDRGY